MLMASVGGSSDLHLDLDKVLTVTDSSQDQGQEGQEELDPTDEQFLPRGFSIVASRRPSAEGVGLTAHEEAILSRSLSRVVSRNVSPRASGHTSTTARSWRPSAAASGRASMERSMPPSGAPSGRQSPILDPSVGLGELRGTDSLVLSEGDEMSMEEGDDFSTQS